MSGAQQLFVIGAPRSGTTIVAQVLNAHDQIKIFDEVGLIDVHDFGGTVVGKLRAFLLERGFYDEFTAHAEQTADPAVALRRVMNKIAAPRLIWGEKNPMYATRLDDLARCFPAALSLFVLRDPREVVNSYLIHRASPFRAAHDFWIKDSVTEALALVERCLEPLQANPSDLAVLRYERFIAEPKAALEEVFLPWGLTFPQSDVSEAHAIPETVSNMQFYRRGSVLPWKLGNLSPVRSNGSARARIDAFDPAWARVDAFARSVGYD